MKRLIMMGIVMDILLTILGSAVLVGVGPVVILKYYEWKYAREKAEIIEIMKSEEADIVIKKFLKELDPEAFTPNGKIQKYTVDYEEVQYIQTGSMSVTIYINEHGGLYVNCTMGKNELKKEPLHIESWSTSLKLERVEDGSMRWVDEEFIDY